MKLDMSSEPIGSVSRERLGSPRNLLLEQHKLLQGERADSGVCGGAVGDWFSGCERTERRRERSLFQRDYVIQNRYGAAEG
jgi:hypothetical protein